MQRNEVGSSLSPSDDGPGCSNRAYDICSSREPTGTASVARGAGRARPTVTSVTTYRRAREWLREHPLVGDAVLAAIVLALTLVSATTDQAPDGRPVTATPFAYAIVVLCALCLVMRRRYPVGTWATIVALGTIGVLVEGHLLDTALPTMIAIYTVATRRPWRAAIAVTLATAAVLAASVWAVSSTPLLADATYALLAIGGMSCAIGIAVRSQRAVVAAAEERATIAEQTREEEAQRRVTEERLRIARELHDVVAHHIAVINVQAGVAQHLMADRPEQAAESLTHVRESSQVVLSEMGTILGLLRTTEDSATRQPTPVLDEVDDLVESMRRAGLEVSWSVTGTPAPLPPGTELAAYRLVQESLTNARKHGAGHADLAVRYTQDSVVIDVVNAMAAPSEPPGDAGHGLVGMRERVAALGGVLQAGPAGGDRFAVHAELPTRSS